MKIDHLVMNVDKSYQLNGPFVNELKEFGLPYNPKKGKGTKGFQATNLWIGKEYFEMIYIKNEDGGGWKKEWVEAFHQQKRGLICLMLDVHDLDAFVQNLQAKGIPITLPENITIQFFFKLISKTMPWRNSYMNFFHNVPMQIGFQQMDDVLTKTKLQKYMVPNSKENNITGIKSIRINGDFLTEELEMLKAVFPKHVEEEGKQLTIQLEKGQQLIFVKAETYTVEVNLKNENRTKIKNEVWIENTKISCDEVN